MNYIYLGLGDLYLPAVAAALHLGRLDAKEVPNLEALLALHHFRDGKKDDGKLYCVGEDQTKNKVYITCAKAQPDVVERAIMSLLTIYSINAREVQVRPCLPENPQVVTLKRLFGKTGLKKQQLRLACRFAQNRFTDLVKISGKDKN
ncbi:MAG: DUF3189 family protein [Dethiobacter sp.]|jgi:hypothetical protein|nr:DUF3189 family protein [Dethiobacter sp.]